MSGNRRFAAVGRSANDASYIGYSSNGEEWTVVSETNGLFFGGNGGRGIASDGNGTFVAVGDSQNDASNIGYSFDGGDTWRVASLGNLDGLFFGG